MSVHFRMEAIASHSIKNNDSRTSLLDRLSGHQAREQKEISLQSSFPRGLGGVCTLSPSRKMQEPSLEAKVKMMNEELKGIWGDDPKAQAKIKTYLE